MTLQTAGLGLHFLLELCALAALAYWGWQAPPNLLLKLTLSVGTPFVAAIVWGTFRVPNDPGRAPVAIAGWLRLVLEFAVFGSAIASLAVAGHTLLATLFGLAVLVDYLIMHARVRRLWRGG
jgi:hypothetical protein